jgi:hypothetical protein
MRVVFVAEKGVLAAVVAFIEPGGPFIVAGVGKNKAKMSSCVMCANNFLREVDDG